MKTWRGLGDQLLLGQLLLPAVLPPFFRQVESSSLVRSTVENGYLHQTDLSTKISWTDLHQTDFCIKFAGTKLMQISVYHCTTSLLAQPRRPLRQKIAIHRASIFASPDWWCGVGRNRRKSPIMRAHFLLGPTILTCVNGKE